MSSASKTMHVPYIDLGIQYRNLKSEIDPLIEKILASGSYILGEHGAALEKEYAAYQGVAHAVGVASGTDAIELALRAAGIGAGDEVIVPSFTFVATAEAVMHVGARPVFVDIEPDTYGIDPAQTETAVTSKTKAIIPVHLYGHPCTMEPILSLAKSKGLQVIEDCAQGTGASIGNKKVGSLGRLGAFSFFPTKNLGACGDAGIIVTDRADDAEKLRWLRNHGSPKKYQHEILGRNSRLDEIQAAILRVKLKHLDRWNQERIRVAGWYDKAFKALPPAVLKKLTLPSTRSGLSHVYHIYALLTAQRDALWEHLKTKTIDAAVHYPEPLHRQPVMRSIVSAGLSLPVSERVAREVLSLPIYPEMTEAMVLYVVEAIHDYYRAGN